ncbi:OmpP1/FadL family transporter [Aquipseudomonas guryensis]|uniref:Transporter n=1 Tax=Aquipseudomonas guryensis TaxID=2759165 RepID=A0A7W4DE95_9GAMM|nr:OmpP1/FadL family transporter [Pseudomonas guryensis]MBB1520941.1 transporter [Pseudomonas guryensis]
MKPNFPLTLLACLVALPIPALAGGLMLYEVGTDNVGLANAGAAARAQGPGTLASNVAGMALLSGTQVSGGAQLLHGNMRFEVDESTNVGGGDSGNSVEWIPAASLFVTHELGDGWSVGFANYGDFGLSVDYEDDWSGRYFLQDGGLMGMTFMPTVAYQLDEQWSFGLGLNAYYAMLTNELAVDNRNPHLGDGHAKYEADDWSYGASLGAIYSPRPGTRLGLSYTSEIDLEFEDKMELEGLGPLATNALQNRGVLDATTTLDMHVPQTLTFSVYHELDAQWALLASANWQDWSRFGEVGIDLDSNQPKSAALNANFKDTWHLSLGTQYRFDPRWMWTAGVGYDSSAVDDEDRSVTVPMAENWRFATGLTHALDEQTEVNVSYVFAWMGDMPVTQEKPNGTRVSGSFDGAWIQALSTSATWRF